ncbi:hypothetical protein FH972_023152 [Carpinus fangiana]|uniref:Smr domain-containing protein n=1 Tax=Carpinus fangiana TaxID=176857 RepID=A0A5N6KUN5_9ROSI|nr:hypothetical protein FH972_023152 [Carpinus fangiana]
MEEPLVLLEREYCPPLDVALVTAIAFDYDLSNAQGLRDARSLLEQLREDAGTEAEAFDASGTSGCGFTANVPGHDDGASSGLTSSNHGLPCTSPNPRSEAASPTSNGVAYGMFEESLPLEQQIQAMLEIFPSAKYVNVRHTLQKSQGNWDRAMDELLNLHFIEHSESDDSVSAKGIEAFSAAHIGFKTPKRLKRSKRRDRTHMGSDDFQSDSTPLPTSPATTTNVWSAGKKDVEFICTRIGLPYNMVASLYHYHNASLPETLTAILQENSTKLLSKASEDETVVQVNAVDLGHDFPTIDHHLIVSLIRVTYPSTAAAHELAKELVKKSQTTAKTHTNTGKLTIIPNYLPLNLDHDDAPWPPALGNSTLQSVPQHGRSGSATLASHYDTRQQRAFSQAAAAYRRGKSDHLMGAAAGYYSQIGRDFAAKRNEAVAGDADALVAANSSQHGIDLHGVRVVDAVRIARTKTEDWWRSRRGVMGFDGRIGEASGGESFKIITGQGRHSAGGVGKLGPAVGKMLFAEGWRCVVDDGMYTVLGKRK